MTTFELLSVFIAAVAALINLGAFVFVGLQVRHAVGQSRKAAADTEFERRRQCKRDTIEAARATVKYREQLKAKLPWNDRDATQVKAYLDEAEGDDETKLAIRAYLDYLEMLAVGANEGVLDVETLSRMSGSRILAVADNYQPYIVRRRQELKAVPLLRAGTAGQLDPGPAQKAVRN